VGSSYFDIVVLGSDLSPLMCAALLSKRGFRVLVLGQQYDRPDYQLGRYRLPRRPFLFAGGRGALCRRLFAELGLTQSLRRSARGAEGAFQVALPGHRFDVPGDAAELEPEIAREFPALLPRLPAFRAHLDELMQQSDALFEHDSAWPPDSLFDRRRVARIQMRLQALAATRPSLLTTLGARHPFRWGVLLPSLFAANCPAEALTDLQLTRLFTAHGREVLNMEGGFAALADLLTHKIRAHSGQLRLHERASQIVVEDGAVRGIRLFGSEDQIGAPVVVTGVDIGGLQRLLVDRSPLDQLFERVGEPRPELYRYTLNAVVRNEGLPAGIRRDIFFMRDTRVSTRADNAVHVEVSALDAAHSLLCCEALLPAQTPTEREQSVKDAREVVLAVLSELVPFIDRHLVLVDSPHDGRRPAVHASDFDASLDRSERRGVPTMPLVYSHPGSSELCAIPVKTPLRGLLVCNQQVAPGLGVEGQLLAAASAAHVACRADRAREWMRKKLWTKVDI
jgi:phytoene dehydrogenase-like protein